MNRKKSPPRPKRDHEEDVERPVSDEEARQAEEITDANLELAREHGDASTDDSRLEQVSEGEVEEGPDDRPQDAEDDVDAALSKWAARRSGG